MGNLKARLEAKKQAKLASTTGNTSLKKETPVETPQSKPEQAKPETKAVNQGAQNEAEAASTQPNKPQLKRKAGGLIAAALAKKSEATTSESASDVLARAKAAQSVQAKLPQEEAATKPKLSVGSTAPKRENAAAQMLKGGVMEMDTEQLEAIHKCEGLQADQFLEGLSLLETYLTDEVPDIATLQQATHSNLRQYPELTHILNDAQVGVIVQGLAKRRNIEIVTPTKGNKGKTNVKNLTRNMSAGQLLDSL